MFLATVFAVTLLSTVSALSLGKEVAFYAVLDSIQIIKQNTVVVYRYVTINEGGGYNNVTGIFTSPKGGIYVFHIDAMITKNEEFPVELYKNDECLIPALGSQQSCYVIEGNTIALLLIKNDRVYVKTQQKVQLYGLTDEVYVTFSGYLIGN